MPDYRLYLLNGRGRFARAEIVDASDDASALAKARQIEHKHAVEVWCGARKVGVAKSPH